MGREGRRPLRVLAVDDSAVMRGVLKTVFDLHASQGDLSLPRMELCGLVRDGVEALEAVKTLTPDVLLLDLEMPRMNGLEVLQKLRTLAPALPVIMCSAHTERGARSTLDALSLGAKDYVMKPGQQKDFAAALDTLMEQLLPKIAALSGWGLVRTETRERMPAATRFAISAAIERMDAEPTAVRMQGAGGRQVELLVIGVSTGGPAALEAMLPMLPKDFPVPVMIVQHMPVLFTGALAERLDRICRMPVRQARDGAAIGPGEVWLAPGDAHMEVAHGAGPRRAGAFNPVVKLHQKPALNSCKPSVDYLFCSAAAMYGAGTLALVMTGMGSDGFDGAKAVRAAGGAVLAQDQATSAVWGMPGRVAKEGVATAVLPLPAIAAALMMRVQEGRASQRMAAAAAEQRREAMHGVL
jgi:two-component system, chemotaxis family, protein-glutamate methylesterase/glutaminase